MSDAALWRRLLAEFLGSAFLAAVVIGSGIAAQRLSPGATGLELLENAAATAAGLFAIILMFGPVSGGHFNPVVSFVDAAFGGLSWRDAAAYLPAQVAGCIGGAILANLMFALPAVSISAKHRATPAHFLSEIIATLGLILVIFALARSGRSRVRARRGRRLHRRGVLLHLLDQLRQPGDHRRPHVLRTPSPGSPPPRSPAFVAAQITGGVLAFAVVRALYPGVTPAEAADVVVPHPGTGRTRTPRPAAAHRRPPTGGPAGARRAHAAVQ